jgi:hypothetical protein
MIRHEGLAHGVGAGLPKDVVARDPVAAEDLDHDCRAGASGVTRPLGHQFLRRRQAHLQVDKVCR